VREGLGEKMSEVSHALQKIARGTGIVFVGTIISMLLGFLSKAIIARYFSTGEYGVFNLTLTVLSISVVIATLGFGNSLPRQIAVYKEEKPHLVKGLISTAVFIVLSTSLLLLVLVFSGADKIAQILHDERLEYSVRIIVMALPFSALISVLVAISRGFGRVRERVYFQSIVYPSLFLILLLIGGILKVSFSYVFFAYLGAHIITFFLLGFDITRTRLVKFSFVFIPSLGKGLLLFSLPLMFNGILGFIMNWTDTLMLGYYLTSEVVGVYNAAAPLARILQIFLTSLGFLYVPIASQLYVQGKIHEIDRVYKILTKWMFLLTFPMFSAMFLFPQAAISFFFGSRYIGASVALQILTLSFLSRVLLGLNGVTLTVVGKPTINLIGNSFAAILNISLNAVLIPYYGLNGAAFATFVSYFFANVFRSVWLYKKSRIHPFGWSYIKLLIISFVSLGLIRMFSVRFQNMWYVILGLAMFLGVYGVLILLTRIIEKEDVEVLLAIEKKLGIDAKILKKFLSKFV